MTRINTLLAKYLLKKEVITKKDKEVYEYGITLLLEKVISIMICMYIAYRFDMIVEAMVFGLFFVPLRSYAGGLHLEKYFSCLLLSCLSFSFILIMAKYIKMPALISFIVSFLSLYFIYILYPVENRNRIIDEVENDFFRKKLRRYIIADAVFVSIVFSGKCNRYLFLITETLLLIVITMILGKIKNREEL